MESKKVREIEVIREKLFQMADDKYREFHCKLVPNMDKEKFIGVRVPDIRSLAKELVNEWLVDGLEEPERNGNKLDLEKFLSDVPHEYYEEKQLHSFLIDYLDEDFETCLKRTESFLPEIDNWAICDSFKPSGMKKDMKKLYEKLVQWMESDEPYTVRLAVVLQISWFLENLFEPAMLDKVLQVAVKWSRGEDKAPKLESDQYYVLMAVSWYFSIALFKYKDATVGIFIDKKLPRWVHNKSLQKVLESTRYTYEQKAEFKEMKVR